MSAVIILGGVLYSTKQLFVGISDPLRDKSKEIRRLRVHSAASEIGISDKIEEMFSVNDVIERWQLERTLDIGSMTEEEEARWTIQLHRRPRYFYLRAVLFLVVLPFLALLFLVVSTLLIGHLATVDWAFPLCLTCVVLGWLAFDAFAVSCLSVKEHHKGLLWYVRRFFITTSKVADDGVDDGVDDGTDPPSTVSPMQNPPPNVSGEESAVKIELQEMKKSPNMISNPSSRGKFTVSSLKALFEKKS